MKKYSGLLSALGFALALVSIGIPAQDEEIDEGAAEAEDTTFSAEGGSRGQGSSDRRAYVSPMFSYTLADSDRNTKDGIGGTMSVGKRVTSGLNLELTATYVQMDWDGGGSEAAELTGVGAAALIFPVQSLPGLYGVLALHHGQVKKHPTSPVASPCTDASNCFDYRTTIFDPGVGYLFPLTDGGIYLRTEARYRMDAHNRKVAGTGGNKHFYEGVFNVGVVIPLGELPVIAPPPEEVAVVESAPSDTDGDGVSDDMDTCPDTPAGVPTNEQGCEADTDGDGVVDRLDTCPDTPAGTAVSETGCTAVVDADGDGIPDDKDQCADTPAGVAVDENGCPAQAGCRAPAPGEPITLEGCATGDAIVLRGVTFDTNSSRLTANAKVILNQVADALNARTDLKVEIGGHTDSVGSDSYNQKLSERRARSVHDYLVARGITPSRMQSRGYGETQPVDSNETNEGREINRRVEMKVIEGSTQ